MNTKNHYSIAQCDGSLALALDERPQFRVIEGGKATSLELPRLASLQSAVGASHNVDPQAMLAPRYVDQPVKRVRQHRRAQSAQKAVLYHQYALLLCTCVLALVVALAWIAVDHAHTAQVDEAFAHTTYQTATVMPGTTLWSLAESHPVEGCSTREVVAHIRAINHLESASLSVGMQLQVPVEE